MAKEALERERGFSSALLDALGALVCIIDRTGHIVRFNRACELVSGYTIDEVRNRPFWDLLIPPDDVEGIKRAFRYLVDERLPNERENDWITKTGERRRIRWSNTVLCNGSGRLAYVLGTGIDISELRRTEAERQLLFVKERRLRELAERAEQRAAFLADAGRVLSGSLDYTRTLSEVARVAVPRLADWCSVRIAGEDGLVRTLAFAHVDPGLQARGERQFELFDLPMKQTLLSEVAEGGSLLVNGATACLDSIIGCYPESPDCQRAIGLLRDLGLSSFMIVPLVAHGRFFGAVLLVSGQEAWQYGHEHLVLAEALAARAALAVENARAYREAQLALQAREEFLTIASHELRTPLTSLQLAIQGLLRIAREAGSSADPPSRSALLLGAVERSTARLGALVEDLLDISGLSAATPVPVLEDVDLRAVVAEVEEHLSGALQNVGCVVQRTSRGPTDGRWDRRWLVRIVTNLVSNAGKYGRGRPIEIALVGGEQTVRLQVRDHGIGIAAEEQARIFDRFERAASVRHYGGFGLGLWIVRRMVDALGGTVRVDSRLGEGAIFTIDLPRQPRS